VQALLPKQSPKNFNFFCYLFLLLISVQLVSSNLVLQVFSHTLFPLKHRVHAQFIFQWISSFLSAKHPRASISSLQIFFVLLFNSSPFLSAPALSNTLCKITLQISSDFLLNIITYYEVSCAANVDGEGP